MMLPRGWQFKKLDELGFVGRGRSRHRPRNDPALYGGPYPFVQTADIAASDYRIRGYSKTYSEVGLAQSKLWSESTLLITIAGENTALTAVLEFPACFPDSIVGFIPDPEKSNICFVKYAVDLMKSKFRAITRGATQDNLSLHKLLSFDIPTPPIEVQEKIAAIVSTYDDLIEVNERRIAILEEMARRLFDEWFVHFRYPGHEDVPLVDSPLGPIPKGWEPCELGQIVEERRDSVDPSEESAETPYVGLEHIPRRSTTLRHYGRLDTVTSMKFRFLAGDILFGKIRPYFHKVALMPYKGLCSSDAIVIRPLSPFHMPLALCTISSDAFVGHAVQTSNGTKMPRANWKVLKKYPVLVPPTALLGQFNDVVGIGAQQAMTLNKQNENLRAQRELLLPKLISGEINVSAAEEMAGRMAAE